jgi:hypothetical protein
MPLPSLFGGKKEVPEFTIEQLMTEVNKSLDLKLKASVGDAVKLHIEPIKAQVDTLTSQLPTINEALGKLISGGGAPPAIPPGGGAPPASGGGNPAIPPEVNVQLREQTQQIKTLTEGMRKVQADKEAAEKRAEETDRFSQVRTALQGMPFVSEQAANTAFQQVIPHVRRLDDQSLVATVNGDNFPVSAFSKEFLEKEHAYLFKSSGSSGSGAPAQGTGVHLGPKGNTDMIKPGMSATDRAAVMQAIREAMPTSSAA